MSPDVKPLIAPEIDQLEAYRAKIATILADLDLEAVSAAVEHLHGAWRRRALIAVAGNGGSASTASHMTTDLIQATRVEGRPTVRALSLVDNVPLLTAVANDESYEMGFARQVEATLRAGDVLILISASGNSANTILAAKDARLLGASTIALVGFDGGELAETCDLVVHARSEHGDYGPVEDAHLVVNHMISSGLLNRIREDES